MQPTQTSQRDFVTAILDIAKGLEPAIAAAWLAALQEVKDMATLTQLANSLRAGDVYAVYNVYRPEAVQGRLQGFSLALADSYTTAGKKLDAYQPTIKPKIVGRAGVNYRPGQIAPDYLFEVRFNQLNPRLVDVASKWHAELVRELSNEVRAGVEESIRRMTLEGKNPLATAREIRENLGLTAKQQQAVANYRKALENLDKNALERKLRDRRFDPRIDRAIRDNKALPSEVIDKYVERYRQKMVKQRAETIARTEALRNTNMANQHTWENAVEEGVVAPEQVRRKWINTKDGRTRDAHISIPQLNKEGRGLREAFISPLGPIMYPHDPAARAANTVNCRCTLFYRIDF